MKLSSALKQAGLFAVLMAPVTAMAQTATVTESIPASVVIDAAPHFATAIITGIILALAFQMVLSILGLAGGLSLTPNLMKSAAKAKADRLAAGHPLHMDDDMDEHEHREHHAAAVKIVSELGIWTLVTTSLAVFLGTWLSMRLTVVSSIEHRYVLALVVWAAFLTVVMYLEWKSVKSLAGGLLNIAVGGFTAGAGLLHGLVAKSPAKQLEDVGRHTVHSLYKELSHAARKSDVSGAITKYLGQLKPAGLDYDRIHDELASLLSQAKEVTDVDVNTDKLNRLLSKKLESRHPLITKKNMAKLSATISQAAQSAKNANRSSDRLFGIAEAFMFLPEGQAKALREKMEDYLGKLQREELNPESIRADIEKIIDDPGSAKELIGARLSHINGDTVKAILAKHGVDNAKTEQIVQHVKGAVETLKGKYAQGVSSAGDTAHRLQDQAKDLPQALEQKINGYLDSLELPHLNVAGIQAEIEDILHRAGDAPHQLKDKLTQITHQPLIDTLKNNPFIEEDQVQKIVDNVMQTRDDFARRFTALEDQAVALYETTRRKATIAAEHARKASIAAAWWVTGTAFSSAIFALLGAYFSQMRIGF